MSDFYSGLAGTVTGLITKFGVAVTFTRPTTGAFDPILGDAAGSPTTYTGIGAKFNYKAREINGTLIQAGDIKLICNALATAPAIDDRVTLDGVDYRIINITSVKPADTIVAYFLQVRK